MIPGVIFDIRGADVRTHAEMDEAVEDRIAQCRIEFDAFLPMGIVLHESQAKWLKLELFEHGGYSAKQLRKMHLGAWKTMPVYVVDDWERLPCPNCGQLHG